MKQERKAVAGFIHEPLEARAVSNHPPEKRNPFIIEYPSVLPSHDAVAKVADAGRSAGCRVVESAPEAN